MANLSVAQVATRLCVEPRIVRYWCGKGFLKGAEKVSRDWVIPEASLAKFVRPKPGPKRNTPPPVRERGGGEGEEASDRD